MAELAISAAAAASIFVELGVPKIWEKLNVNKHVKKDVERFKTWLPRMQAYVKANYNHGTLDARVEQVRDIAFEIEDVLDEIVLHSPHVFHRHNTTQKFHKLGHNIRHGFPLHRIPEKIANIKTKLDDLTLLDAVVLATDSGSNSASGSGSSIEQQVISPPFLDHEMVGYTKLKETFILPGYLHLSSNLKSCFLYFGLFPEDYSVERGRLIRLWVAEGFVTGTDIKTAEEVAEIYLDKLINRNLVHVSNRDFDGRPKTCRVLSPILTFIVEKCKEEIFASIFAIENTSATHNIVRRLSVLGDCSHLPQSINFAVIRSVFIFRCGMFSAVHLGNSFGNFNLLRVLDLQGAPLTEFPQQITRLILLRYVSLRGTNIKSIPESIRNLFYLITLDLKQTGVTQLPEAVSRLCNLRHLFVYQYNVDNFVAFDSVRGVKIFERIENLTNLQKLYLVKVGKKGGIIRELKKLRHLRKLGLTGIKSEHGKDLCASL